MSRGACLPLAEVMRMVSSLKFGAIFRIVLVFRWEIVCRRRWKQNGLCLGMSSMEGEANALSMFRREVMINHPMGYTTTSNVSVFY